jgi:hypothetical protein
VTVEHGSASVSSNRVLVVGVYLADVKNAVEHLVAALDQSAEWKIDQRWMAIGTQGIPEHLAGVTHGQQSCPSPKFTLLNRLLAAHSLKEYAFVIVCDDDILLPPNFLDTYLSIVRQYDFALSQPARTHDSYIDHAFVEQFDGLIARQTRFVEIGPLFCVRQDAGRMLLPFDEQSPMGWGYDLAWPCTLEKAGLKLGIVDRTPVAHSIRKPVSQYDHATADAQMSRYLQSREHLSKANAFFIVDAYA